MNSLFFLPNVNIKVTFFSIKILLAFTGFIVHIILNPNNDNILQS